MSASACERTIPELVAYLDDALSADARRPVAEHLATCLPCRRELERMVTVRGWISTLPLVEPSPSFVTDFARRLAAEPTPITARRPGVARLRWIAPTLAVAALLALVLRSLTTAPSGPPPTTPPEERVVRAPARPVTKPAPAVVAGDDPTSSAPPQLATVDQLPPEDLPPELLEHPELFLRLPVVRRLETLEYLGSLHEHDAPDDGGAG